jgi:streptomycin 6-kinase
VPEALRGFDRRQHQGEAGRRWPAALPDTGAEWCDRWNLEVDGQPMHGYHSLVVPVGRDGEPPALKLTWPDRHTEEQMPALRLWDGLGAVRLVDADIAAAVVGGVGITLHGVWWYTALNHACPPDARGRLHDAAVPGLWSPSGWLGLCPLRRWSGWAPWPGWALG